MPGVVPELFVVEKYLLARCEHKLRAAVHTLQNSIGEFHGRLPLQGASPKSAMARRPSRSRFPVLLRPVQQGPGPHKNSSGKKNPFRFSRTSCEAARVGARSNLSRDSSFWGIRTKTPDGFFTWARPCGFTHNDRQKLEKR
jgi:hypothetical protein